MDYAKFRKFLEESCVYEAIYTDSDGREIIVLRVVDLYVMINDAINKEKQNE
jgi:hypothetical protein